MERRAYDMVCKKQSIRRRVDSVLCDEPNQVYENLKDQREKGREVWIEDKGGRRVEEQVFAQPTGGEK